MPETKSGTESIQKMPGTCSCTRKKGSHQKLWISSKGQRSQFEGIQKGQAVLKKKKRPQMIETHGKINGFITIFEKIKELTNSESQ